MSIRVKVPGKLIILGEYAVLEGADALVASVNRFVTVKIIASRRMDNNYPRAEIQAVASVMHLRVFPC